MNGTWCFRLRFDLGATTALSYNEPEWVMHDSPPIRVCLRPADNEASIADARRLSACGSGYSTEEDARTAGLQWKDWLILALSYIDVGADFGDRAPSGWFSEHGLAWVRDSILGSSANKEEAIILNDVHGLMTYKCEPAPRFARVGNVTGIKRTAHERLAVALSRAVKSSAVLTPEERLAYDLYSASFSEPNADARFMMLMMAIETLIRPRQRSPEVRALVDTLIATTEVSALPKREIASIKGTLNWLHEESIGQAGRRLAMNLGDRKYNGESPKTFFTRCYDLRSRLVHGVGARPDRDEVGLRAAHLEIFVGNLISRSLLDDS